MILALLAVLNIVLATTVIDQGNRIDEEGRVFDDVSESVVVLESPEGGWGTGFVVDTKSGKQVIVTNDHVCAKHKIQDFIVSHRSGAALRDTASFLATVIARDLEQDLCILSVPPDLKVRSLPIAESAPIDSRIHIVGYPKTQLLSSVSGYIRGLELMSATFDTPPERCIGRKLSLKTVSIKNDNGTEDKLKVCTITVILMFTDATEDLGSSGSPVLNGDGEVVGVQSMISGTAKSYAYMVPLTSLKRFLSNN